VAAAVLVVSAAIVAGFAVRWWRRSAPVPIGEGIRAIGRINHSEGATDPSPRAGFAERRRRQVRFVSSLVLGALAVAIAISSHRRGLAEVFALLFLARLAFEMLARRRHVPHGRVTG
jgi:uncharacterized membrane protein (UPF0136 family)